MAILRITSGHLAGQALELRKGLNRLGRSEENDFPVNDPSISSFHCEISVSDIHVAVTDLKSTNGTFVNQNPVMRALLQPGDLLMLGEVEFAVDLPEVKIAIPEMSVELEPEPVFLEDGSAACRLHADIPATLRCTKYEHYFCTDCARALKKLNGQLLYFCPECDAPCVAVVPLSSQTKSKRGFLEKLQETLRLTRRR